MTKFYRHNVNTFISTAVGWGFAGPAVLSFALLNVEGYELALGNMERFFSRVTPKSDRPHLVLPDVWVENLETADIDGIVRPMMDILWQAFGVERCPDFDAKTGEFNPQKSY